MKLYVSISTSDPEYVLRYRPLDGGDGVGSVWQTLTFFYLVEEASSCTELESRQALMRERKDFNLAALFDRSVFAATRDSVELFKPGAFEILPSDQWSARKSSLVESFETTTTRPPGTAKRGPRSELGSHYAVLTMIARVSPWACAIQILQRRADIGIFAAGKLRTLFDHRDLRAESTDRLREFQAHVAAAEDDEVLR
jgi:hypothetical protein